MTTTDELRKLLDEHGVKHEDKHTELVPDIDGWDSTWWQGIAGMTFLAVSDETCGREDCVYINGTYLTPEQAIAATIGHQETCQNIHEDCDMFLCSECSECVEMHNDYGGYDNLEHLNYCPNCGRKVVEE